MRQGQGILDKVSRQCWGGVGRPTADSTSVVISPPANNANQQVAQP
jgi:hypothetical protein